MLVEIEKRTLYFNMLYMWHWGTIHGVSIIRTLIDRGIHKIAIYGLTELGMLLYQEAEMADLEVSYVIDKNKNVLCECDVYSPEEEYPDADIIIITAEFYIDEISELLLKKTKIPFISLCELICQANNFDT